MSTWTVERAQVVQSEILVDVLAVQETHLARLHLEWANGTARRLGLQLYHGHPVPTAAREAFGRSCGVGFLSRQGVALAPVLPVGGYMPWGGCMLCEWSHGWGCRGDCCC